MKIKNLLTTMVLTAIFLIVGKVGWGQTTGDFRSAATGNWNATATWERYSSTSTWEAFGVGENTGTGLPLNTSSIFILDAHTVTINQNVTVANINIGTGTGGILTFDGTSGRAVTVSGDITIANGGVFSVRQPVYYITGDLTSGSPTITNVSSTTGIANGMNISGAGIIPYSSQTVTAFDAGANTITLSGNAVASGTGVCISVYSAPANITNTISIGGNIINNGVFDMWLKGTNSSVCNVTFTKTADQSISGSGPLTRFSLITLNKGSVSNRVLCSSNVFFTTSNTITYTAGTWEQTANKLTVLNGTQNIALATGALVISGTGSYDAAIGSSISVTGKLEVNTTGTFKSGSGNNNVTAASGSTINFLNGDIYIYGKLALTSGTTTISGANIFIDPQVGTTYLAATGNVFELGASGNLTFSSGSVTIVDPLNATGTGLAVKISSGGTNDLTGSTFIFGDGVSTTTGPDGFELSSALPLKNVTLQTGGAALRNVNLVYSTTTINGKLTMKSGALNVGSSALTYGTSAIIEYAGSAAQSSGAELITSVPNLTINNTNGVTLTSSTTVVNALTFTNGQLSLGDNNLTIVGSTGSIVGASSSKYVVTSGAGFLYMNPNGVNDLTYPVGPTSTSYNPFLVTDNTSTDYIGGNIKNSITNASLSDASCVQLQWKATESTTSDNDGTISFQWNASNHGGSFNPALPVYLGYWNGTGYDKTLVSVTGSDPYVVTIPAPSTIGTNPIIFGNAAAFPLDAPALTADATANNVDNNIEITFTDDATWRGLISAVKDGATPLTVTTDYTVAAGVLTLIPHSGNSLKTPGSRTITVSATGYADATVTQTVGVGAINVTNSTLSNTPALSSVDKTTTVTATAKDQFSNLIEGYIFKFDATTTDLTGTTDESYTIAGTGYTANATDVALAATNAAGVVTFDVVLPATIDGNDGVSVQVQLNDGTTNFKSAIGYIAPVDPAATISPATIAEHSLNNAVVTILIQNATFAATLDKANYTLNNAPLGLTITSITRTDDTHADLTLAYDDAGNDFDADVANFNVTVKIAELVGATVDVVSNNITLVATVETAPTATIASAITSVSETTATWAGEATATGGEAVTEKGICWSTSSNPTIDDVADFKTTEGAGLGAIAGSMASLTANTVYYVRAYATNSVGTAYSAEKTFRTLSAEPTNHVNTFVATATAANLVLTWANNDGATVPSNYLIKASTTNNITDPVDGVAVPAENLVIGDNNGVKVVANTETTYTWTGLTPGATYYFKIYPFTKNDVDNLPNYKAAAAPAANAVVNSDAKAITATSIGTLSATKINDIPATTTVGALKTAITVSPNATKDILVAAGGASAADADLITNTMVVKVTAQNGTSQEYGLMLFVESDLFISEYIEGGSNNKAVEIFNPKSTAVDLSQYTLKKGTNGANFTTSLALSGTLEPGAVFVVAHTSAVDSVKSVAQLIDNSGAIVYFNGNDAVGLFKGDVLLDVIGTTTGTDPGTGWAVAGVASATANKTLVRKNDVLKGSTDWSASAGTDANNSEWVVYPQDRFAFLGWHKAKSSANDILTFVITGINGAANINTTNHTVDIEMVYGTDVTALTPTITISKFATISPASGVQQNFTNPVVYSVTAQDGTIQQWTVRVTVAAALSDAKEITGFNIPDQISSTIDVNNATVSVVMPYGRSLTSLTPTIQISSGATISPNTGVARDFTATVSYVVTAQNSTTKTWNVTVTNQVLQSVSIYDIQYTTATPAESAYKGQQVKTKGLVVGAKSGTNSTNFYLQDGAGAWKGIYVFGSTTAVTLGDSVELGATVEEYYNLTQLKSVVGLKVINSGNALPEPTVVTLAEASSEMYEGVLIKVKNVECTVLPNNYKEWKVSDGTTEMIVDDLLFEYTPTQGTRYNITGLIDYAFSAFRIIPRSAADVTLTTSTPDAPFASFRVYPNPFTNEIRFEGANVERVVVTSIVGQAVMDKAIMGENYINTNELVRGIYLVKFTNNKGESILRKLIKE